ncbi:hypothetical protein COJ21_24365 [Priestia megaterium]|uniref:PD-(D/E)XK nuclease domain-containing protein n=1 Tax=Priestia megaterium TaxID=1404 RepID=UPI000BF3389A|nr:nucleotidyltransferase domain-containing protein [Priestia megaterium]PFK67053.1 hypothetical protein COJ21_24365 [Priestia megaterium]
MRKKESDLWNLKELVKDIVQKHSEVNAIYLFGSRAYNTGSRRSDIDILIHSDKVIKSHDITDWIREKYPPVDIFKTTDMRNADSIINGSAVQSENVLLDEKLDAIKLWDKKDLLNTSFKRWDQLTDKNVEFVMSYTGFYLTNHPEDVINNYRSLLNEKGIPHFDSGHDWTLLGQSIESIITTAFNKPKNFSKKAKNFSFDTIKINDEYDFQNLIHLLLRSVFPTIQPENKVCIIDGNIKIGDFGIGNNKVVIEAKYIKDTSSKNAVMKTIEGLGNFYKSNPNVQLLVFLVLYEPTVSIDPFYLEGIFKNRNAAPPIFVKFIENCYL